MIDYGLQFQFSTILIQMEVKIAIGEAELVFCTGLTQRVYRGSFRKYPDDGLEEAIFII